MSNNNNYINNDKDNFYPQQQLDVVSYYTTVTEDDENHYDSLWPNYINKRNNSNNSNNNNNRSQESKESIEARIERIQQSQTWTTDLQTFWRRIRSFAPRMWFFLTVLGVIGAFVGYFLDWTTQQIRAAMIEASSLSVGFVDYLIWTCISIVFLLISIGCVYYISHDASGSGIPEMKAFLAGADMETQYLNTRTLIAKVFGLLASLSTGLSIGKEGPFVHIASCLCHALFEIPFFQSLAKNHALKRQLYSAAIAAGVTMAFGTPVGGVFFSIEATATYFLVGNLWKAFFCATWCVFILQVFHELSTVEFFDFNDTTFDRFHMSWELVPFALLGIICGILSAAFTWLCWKFMVLQQSSTIVAWESPHAIVNNNDPRWKQTLMIMKQYFRYYGYSLIRHRVYFSIFIIIITTSIQWLFTAIRNFDRVTINEMFGEKGLSEQGLDHWTKGSLHLFMILFCFIKFILTAVSISLPIPAGVLTPVFALGSVFGRLYGELWQLILPASYNLLPGRYAIVAAAALTSGITRTLSIVIMVFELTGQLTNLLPVMIAVLLSYSVANGLSLSVYDMILNVKDLPYLPTMSHTSGSTITQLLDSNVAAFTKDNTTYRKIYKSLLSQFYTMFPCIDSHHRVIGTINRDILQTLVRGHINHFRQQLTPFELKELDEYLNHQLSASKIARGENHHNNWLQNIINRIKSYFTSTNISHDNNHDSYRPLKMPNNEDEEEDLEDSSGDNDTMIEMKSVETSPDTTNEEDENVDPPQTTIKIDKVKHKHHHPHHQNNTTTTTTTSSTNINHAERPRATSRATWEQEFRRHMNEEVDWSRLNVTAIDTAPLVLNQHVPLPRLHYFFAMLGMQEVIIVNRQNVLVGIVSKLHLHPKTSTKASV